jgi:hypothetical protein
MAQFNPANPEYKQVADLPPVEQEHYRNDEEGFVTQDAFYELSRAEREALSRLLKNEEDVTGQDVLHEVAIREDYMRNRAIKILRDGGSDYYNNSEFLSQYGSKDFALQLLRDESITEKAYGRVLRLLQERQLTEDRDVALALVQKKDFGDLAALPERFRDDEEIVVAAITNNPRGPVSVISERLRKDKNIALLLASKIDKVIHEEDRIKKFEYFGDNIKKDREVAKLAVEHDGNLLKVFSDFQNDGEIVRIAIQNTSAAFRYASELIKNSRDFVLWAVQNANYRKGVPILGQTKFLDDEEIALLAVKNYGGEYMVLSDRLQRNVDIVIQALAQNPKIIAEVPTETVSEVLHKHKNKLQEILDQKLEEGQK